MTEQVKNVAEIEAQESVEVSVEETPTEVQETEAPATEAPDTEPEAKDTSNREAAKYRRQLREVEAERDQLTEQVAQYKNELLKIALSGEITTPIGRSVRMNEHTDLFAIGGVDADTLFNSDGKVDHDAIGERVGELHANRPELFNKPVKATYIIPDEGGLPNFNGISGGESAFMGAFLPKQS